VKARGGSRGKGEGVIKDVLRILRSRKVTRKTTEGRDKESDGKRKDRKSSTPSETAQRG